MHASLPRLAFIDVETTGANPVVDRVTEIAILRVEDGRLVERWSSLVNPGMAIPPSIQGFTGITDAMVAEAPPFADLADDATLAEGLLKYVFKAVLDERPDDMAFFEDRIEKGVIAKLQGMIDSDFVRMDYTDAIKILQNAKDKFDYPVSWGTDLQSEHERYLAEKHVKGPVVLMNYPKEIKAFYMRQNEDGKTVAAADMLVPGIGELIGGSQREERLDVLEARMKELGLNTADYDWYLDLRRYGSVKHAGYGLGFERLLMYVTGIPNIRDVIPFPRTCGGF